MADAIAVFDAATRVTDASGNPISGGTVEFYNAGTSTPKTVYADANLSVSLGTSVTTNAGGYPVTSGSVQTLVYTGTASYKMIFKDSGGATIITHDNIRGATATPGTTTTAIPTTVITAKTTDYTVTTSDRGILFNFTTASANRTMTLPSAVTVGNNWRVGARIDTGANVLTIVTSSAQTISRPGLAATTLALTGRGECIWLVSDGANWHVDTYVPPFMTGGVPFFSVVDNTLSSPPGSWSPGARFIIKGTPTGGWSSFADKDVVESPDGTNWIRYTPASGWTAALDVSNGRLVQYTGSVWAQAGFAYTSNALGTITSGTVTPDPRNGNLQHYTNNGAHTLAAPPVDGVMEILVTNAASAGAITFSGFTAAAGAGSALTTTVNNKFILTIRRMNAVSNYAVNPLQ
jgi:hypothetical protein